MKAVIALGANLGSPEQTFERAVALLSEHIGRVIVRSRWYQTKPLMLPGYNGPTSPNYLNGAVLIETKQSPLKILSGLHEIERALGRHRAAETSRWLPRVIDLDLICIEQQTLNELALTLPHPEMHKRDFVLEPMLEIWPDWKHPVLGKTVDEMFQALPA